MGFNYTAFAIAPGQNTTIEHDATGAFHPGAQHFARAYNCNWRTYDNTGSPKTVRKRFYDTIDTFCPGSVDLFAYFGHGIKTGLPSPHVYESDLDDFLSVLRPKLSMPAVLVFYACSSGLQGGFTGKIREKLGGDVWVYGHTTVGHSFMNPDVSEEMADNTPSYRLYYPYGTELRAAWAEALKYTDLWLRFPLLYNAALEAEVNSRRLLGTWEVRVADTTYIYEFDTPGTPWSQSSGKDIDAPPEGTVKAFDPKNRRTPQDQGTWTVTDRVQISWSSGSVETWQLPLHVAAQPGTSDGLLLTAKRLSHTLGHGKLQG